MRASDRGNPYSDNSQKFTFRCSKDGTYSLMTVSSNGARCADVYEISKEDGANICQWEYWGGDGQKFVLEPSLEEKAPEPEPQKITGDVNADGKFDIEDLKMMQDFLRGTGMLTDPEAGELCEDGVLNVYDFILMKRLMTNKTN